MRPPAVWLMIALLLVQIAAVHFWGVEPARRSLEGIAGSAGTAVQRVTGVLVVSRACLEPRA